MADTTLFLGIDRHFKTEKNSILLPRLLLAVLAIFLALKFASVAKRAFFTPLRRIPGPWYASWTNLWLKYYVVTGKRSRYIHSLHETYGSHIRISPDEISVSDVASVREVHRIGSKFVKTEWYTRLVNSPQPGMFDMTSPKEHADRRRLFANGLSNSAIRKCEGIVREKVELALSGIRQDIERQGKADILKWMTFMAADMMGELCFGKSFDTLKLGEKSRFVRDVETLSKFNGTKAELGLLVNIAEFLPIAALQDAIHSDERLRAYGNAAIQKVREEMAEHPEKDFKCFFAKLTTSGKEELSSEQMAGEAFSLIVGGTDTTSNSLTFLIWSMLRPQHKRARQKLMAELETLPLDADLADISSLKYLKVVIDESLRLYGAIQASLPRLTPSEGATLGGYFVPSGTIVSAQAYTLHRDERIFASAGQFIPERWENPSQEIKDAYFPFGLGSRTCIGNHLAMSELLLGAFLFFKTFPTAALAESTTDESMEMENFFLMAPKAHRCEVTAE